MNPNYPKMTLRQIRAAMRQACEDAGVPMPRIERGRVRGAYGVCDPSRKVITLRDMRDGPVAIHEIAHWIAFARFGVQDHGAIWGQICANLLVIHCGVSREWAQNHVGHYAGAYSNPWS
jgi:hypothetical protein